MKTLLIVEDEKAIRAGLRAMIANAPVQVETVIECRNGAEAMEILQSKDVDVMLTDIRMPKMDGIELVRRASDLPSPPIMVVISGYSEFDYAVDAFRQGVRDYLLKPIERERVYALLASLQEELDHKDKETEARQLLDVHMLRAVMLDVETSFGAYPAISGQSRDFLSGNYFALCFAPCCQPEKAPGYCLENIDEQTVWLVSEANLHGLKEDCLKGKSAGISGAKSGLHRLRDAYEESLQARRRAFISAEAQEYEDSPAMFSDEEGSAITVEQVTQLLGTGKKEEAAGLLERMLFLAQNHRISPGAFLGFLEALWTALEKTFAHLSTAICDFEKLRHILSYDSALAYYGELFAWMGRVSDFLETDLENRNIRKIRKALAYVGKHFRSQINMAVVSNSISMNYSQFSNLFKQYTGRSFRDYLKNLRLAESRRLLADPALSIRKVGEMSGFLNEKHFMKCFKQETGVSPGDYRRTLQLKQPDDQANQ
ncbi:MAG: response regulator [Clostridiales bacterium]|nr:response regulator [Clostridiales bacterium]